MDGKQWRWNTVKVMGDFFDKVWPKIKRGPIIEVVFCVEMAAMFRKSGGYADEQGRMELSTSQMAERIGRSFDRTRKAKQALIRKGIIVVEPVPHTAGRRWFVRFSDIHLKPQEPSGAGMSRPNSPSVWGKGMNPDEKTAARPGQT